MTSYSSLTVVQLKAILKERGIPTTNLTRKQQIIDRLVEEDNKADAPPPADEEDEQPEAPEDAGDVINITGKDASSAEATQVVESAAPQKEAPQPPPEQTLAAPAPGGGPPSRASSVTIQPEAEEPAPAIPTQEIPATQEPVESREEPSPAVTATPSLSQVPSTDISRVNTVELQEDTRKRKRRSASPPVNEEDVAAKKRKQDENDGVAHFKEDGVKKEEDQESLKAAPSPKADEDRMDVDAKDDRQQESLQEKDEPKPNKAESEAQDEAHEAMASDQRDNLESSGQDANADKKPSENPRKFKTLFTGPPATTAPEQDSPAEVDDLSPAKPALHPATCAIYLRNLMRPLQPQVLRNHLINLATPKSRSPQPEVIELFYLDSIRTHAFVLFSSISAAARVRAALHERIWPAERDRKPLWVDFVPDDKVHKWVEAEEDSAAGGRGANSRRWEVIYENTNRGGVEAVHQEVGAQSRKPPVAPRQPSFSQAPRVQPPRSRTPPTKAFLALDELFKSTSTVKPKLYYQPVSAEVAEKRLDALDRATSRDWKGARGWDVEEMRRYTFEDGDMLVDGGPQAPGPRNGERNAGRPFRGGNRWRR